MNNNFKNLKMHCRKGLKYVNKSNGLFFYERCNSSYLQPCMQTNFLNTPTRVAQFVGIHCRSYETTSFEKNNPLHKYIFFCFCFLLDCFTHVNTKTHKSLVECPQIMNFAIPGILEFT